MRETYSLAEERLVGARVVFGRRRRLRRDDFLEESAQPAARRLTLQLHQLVALEVERARNDVDDLLLLVGGSVEVAEDEVASESPETQQSEPID